MARGSSNVAFACSRPMVRRAFRFLFLALSLPPVTAFVARRGTAGGTVVGIFTSHSSSRICRDQELAEYALLVAVGPAKAPPCRPAPGQSLRAPELPPLQLRGSNFAQHSSLLAAGSGSMHFAHLHVVQSDNNWCTLPCDGPSWELSAPKPAKGSPYLLLEAAIWRQFRKVTLYRFDAEWEQIARDSYRKLCGFRAWGCPAYTNHREAQALLTVGPWPAYLDADAKGLSAWLKDAFAKVFTELHKQAGSDNSRIGLTYSGHGGDADGSLFTGVVNSADAAPLLRNLVDVGGKLSMLNFGTNCQEGRWNMLAAMHPFADWILASDLNVGGLKATEHGKNPEEEMAQLKAKEKLSDVAVLKQSMEGRQSPKDAVASIVEGRRQLFSGAFKKDMTEQKLRQSVSAFVAPQFPAFAAALKSAYEKLPEGKQEEIVTEAEKYECDVLAVARFMDSAGTALVQENATKMRRTAAGALETQFLTFRPEYASTQSLFTWKPVTHGLGFNFRGAWNIDGKIIPRCDLNALGPLAR